MQRLYFIDWIRVFLTATVLVHHCFYIYGFGFWPYYGYWLLTNSIEVVITCWTVLQFNQAYFMGLFFLISGHCAAPSLQRKGPLRYLLHRATRLLIPAACYELLLAPLACAISQGVNNFDFPPGMAAAPSVYSWYFSQYIGVGRSPTWFLFALFLLDVGCVLCSACWRKLAVAGEKGGVAARTPAWQAPGSSASEPPERFSAINMAVGSCVSVALLTLVSFLLRIQFPAGYFLPSIFPGFQPAYFGQYIFAFSLGFLAQPSKALLRVPSSWGLPCTLASLLWFCIGWLGVLLLTQDNASLSPDPDYDAAGPLKGGAGVQALYFAFFEQGFAVLWSLGLLVLAREHFNQAPGRLGSLIIGAAYTVFVVHPLVVFGVTRMLSTAWEVTPQVTIVQVLLECPLVLLATWAVGIAVKAVPYAGLVL